jgi:acyl-CoA thioesterase FadM
VRYRAAAPTKTPLRVEGWIARWQQRAIHTEGRILLPDGVLVADAQATYLPVPPAMVGEMVKAWPGFAEYLND